MLIKRAFHKGLLEMARRRHRPKRRGRSDLAWPEGFVITGFFNEEFGLARSAELTALKLEELGFKVIRHNIRSALGRRAYFETAIDAPEGYGWIVHANPPETLSLLAMLDPKKTPTGLRLGYWAWELDVIPDSWTQLIGVFDEILVPSKFVQNSLSARNIPSRLLTHPVSIGKTVRSVDPKTVDRARVFLVQMDGNSSFERKNILVSIRAFKQAFGGRSEFELILKTRNLTQSHEKQILETVEGASNIRWLNWSLAEASYQELWDKVDCVVSTHRSEGFGLGLAEAAWLNRPVIATGWSGNMDFMCPNDPGTLDFKMICVKPEDEVYGAYAGNASKWADVSIDEVSESLILAAQSGLPGQAESIRRRLSALEYEWDHIGPGSAVEPEHFNQASVL